MENIIKIGVGNPVPHSITETNRQGKVRFSMSLVKDLKRAILLRRCAEIDAVLEWGLDKYFTDAIIHEIRNQTARELSRCDDSDWISHEIQKGRIF